MLPSYAELHCLSNFSFLRGASHPDELVQRAQALGYAALAITDECSLSGIVRAHLAAKEARLPLVIGSEFTIDDGTKLVLLVTDRASYGNLSQLITRGRRNAAKGSYALCRDDVAAFADGLLALWVPPEPSLRKREADDAEALAAARWVAATFPHRTWLAVELLPAPATVSVSRSEMLARGLAGRRRRPPCPRRRALQDTHRDPLKTACRMRLRAPPEWRAAPALARTPDDYPAALLAETVAIRTARFRALRIPGGDRAGRRLPASAQAHRGWIGYRGAPLRGAS
jgi:error-prone DNA polymerase